MDDVLKSLIDRVIKITFFKTIRVTACNIVGMLYW